MARLSRPIIGVLGGRVYAVLVSGVAVAGRAIGRAGPLRLKNVRVPDLGVGEVLRYSAPRGLRDTRTSVPAPPVIGLFRGRLGEVSDVGGAYAEAAI